MAAQQRTGRPNRTIRIVKHAITIGAVALTILGSVALSDERPSAGGNPPVAVNGDLPHER